MKSIVRNGLLVVIAFLMGTALMAQNPDLPSPASNVQTLPSGSLVIAMDNTYQSNPEYFNLKAYGLVITLLNSGKKLKWVIKSGKAKDEADFTVTAQKILPTFVDVTSKSFKSGPFVIFPADTIGVSALINNFNAAFTGSNANKKVNVYRTTVDVAVDIRYDMLGVKPRAAILNDGGNASIHTKYMTNASIPSANYQVLSTASNLPANCFTFASEPHNEPKNAGQIATVANLVDSIRKFVTVDGGNFLAECAAILAYENSANGKFQSSLGFDNPNSLESGRFTYRNSDLPYAQYEGAFKPDAGGSTQSYTRLGGTALNNFYPIIVGNTAALDSVYGASVSKFNSGRGGLVFYLGNHDFDGTDLTDLNGQRMYLNAFLTPALYQSCADAAPTAVKLTSFTGTKIDNKQSQLFWSTSFEQDSKEFVIQRSADGINFFEIGRVAAIGNSTAVNNYSMFDPAPLPGRNFYRVAEVDIFDKIVFSNVIMLNFSTAVPSIDLYPNPATQFVMIGFNNLPLKNTINVFDMAGRKVVSNYTASGNTVKIDVTNYRAGTYIVKVVSPEGKILQNKFVVVKY